MRHNDALEEAIDVAVASRLITVATPNEYGELLRLAVTLCVQYQLDEPEYEISDTIAAMVNACEDKGLSVALLVEDARQIAAARTKSAD